MLNAFRMLDSIRGGDGVIALDDRRAAMAKSVTQTQLTHYEIQKQRRARVVEEWRNYRTCLIRGADVVLEECPATRTRRGVYMGADGGVHPTKVLDATLHEIPAHTTTTVHRHSWDAIMFVTGGSGWTEIDGRRIQWKAWDTLHLPAWAWHRHGNESDLDARYVSWSVQPMHESLGTAVLEEGGDTSYVDLPKGPETAPPTGGDDPYGRRLQRMHQQAPRSDDRRLITRFDEITPKVTKRGARSAFLMDESIGYRTAGLSAVMHELAPGLWQSKHRHGGEAWLHVIDGHGHSEIEGESYEWGPDDLVVVDHWAWHQHFNDDKKNTARLIRVHNFDALYDMMRVLLDPMVLFEEPAQLDAPDVSNVEWPHFQHGRPQ
ncbi:MAG: cupin domain-containing protein [Streptosporangiales bacterium]|nr:cupin domain-containing protein [Streptosporangiales bacterium]